MLEDMTTRDKILTYLHQLAPHVRERQAAQLLYEAIVALDNAAADERRMDWLADLSNETGQVLLPRECVEAHLESMRSAIDMAITMSSNAQVQAGPAGGMAGIAPGTES
jgi:hypothetical protein